MQRRQKSELPLSAAAAQVWALDQLGAAGSNGDRRNGTGNRRMVALAARISSALAPFRSSSRRP